MAAPEPTRPACNHRNPQTEARHPGGRGQNAWPHRHWSGLRAKTSPGMVRGKSPLAPYRNAAAPRAVRRVGGEVTQRPADPERTDDFHRKIAMSAAGIPREFHEYLRHRAPIRGWRHQRSWPRDHPYRSVFQHPHRWRRHRPAASPVGIVSWQRHFGSLPDGHPEPRWGAFGAQPHRTVELHRTRARPE